MTGRGIASRSSPLLLLCLAGCSGTGTPTELEGVQQIVYLQRTAFYAGDVFHYAHAGDAGDQADIYLLQPPTADGKVTNLTRLPRGSDVNAMDLSFDARELVFSARLKPGDPYHLFRVNLDGTNPCDPAMGAGYCQITDGPYDDVYPIYLPGGRIFFMTNQNVEGDMVPQFRDEYERGVTAQAATTTRMGGDRQLGSRNVSHRVFPTLTSDGRVVLSEWVHLGDLNEADLVFLSQDMTGHREAFGKEHKGVTNSYVRAREVRPGQLVAIGTSRDRTYQAGKILLINLGPEGAGGQMDMSRLAEANSSAVDLTPDVPGGRSPSYPGVGRYLDAYPIGDPQKQRFLVTWSDGPVESEVLGTAQQIPHFGIYLYDGRARTRFPIVVPPASSNVWAMSPIAVAKRAEPPMLPSGSMAQGTESTLISALNVYDSTLFALPPGSVKKARIMEGFSGEEGVGNDFGLTEHDGHALLGEVDVGQDGSFKALVPANVPVHIQLVDEFGLNVANEPVWIMGRGREARACGGCHEDRTRTPQLQPGASALQAIGAANLDLPRAQRQSMDFSPAKVKGVPWDKALQPIFDARCVDCHDGSANGANPTWAVRDLADMAMPPTTYQFTFNLTGAPATVTVGEEMYGYTSSHLSLLGPSMLFREQDTIVFVDPLTGAPTGDRPQVYVEPGSARRSALLKMLNPPARYPAVDLSRRAFSTPIHPSEVGVIAGHDGADPKYRLTADEYYLLILMADMGGQFYSRENTPGRN